MSGYLVSLHSKAVDSLHQITAVRKRLVYLAIESLKHNPYPGDEDLFFKIENELYYRIMRGGYWISYIVDEQNRVIQLFDILPFEKGT